MLEDHLEATPPRARAMDPRRSKESLWLGGGPVTARADLRVEPLVTGGSTTCVGTGASLDSMSPTLGGASMHHGVGGPRVASCNTGHSVDASSNVSMTPRGTQNAAGQRGYRSLSHTRALVRRVVDTRAGYEGAALQALRTQMEAFEQKVSSQVTVLQGQSDRLGQTSERTLAQFEEKVSATEMVGPKPDRRIAELNGNLRAFSEEMQAQTRRVDSIEDRLWETQHDLKEELQQRCADLEQQLQKVSSGTRMANASLEDTQRHLYQRLFRLEGEWENTTRVLFDDKFSAVTTRLQALEECIQKDVSTLAALVTSDKNGPGSPSAADCGASSRGADGSGGDMVNEQLDIMKRWVQDLATKSDRVFQDAHEVHSRVAAHETQLVTLRVLLEKGEDRMMRIGEQVDRGGWERKYEVAQRAAMEEATHRLAQQEKLEILLQRVDHMETQMKDVYSAPRRSRYELDSPPHVDCRGLGFGISEG